MIVERAVPIREPLVPERIDTLGLLVAYAARLTGRDPADARSIAPYAIIGSGVTDPERIVAPYWRWGVLPGMYDETPRSSDRLEITLIRGDGPDWPVAVRAEGIFAEREVLEETYDLFSALLRTL